MRPARILGVSAAVVVALGVAVVAGLGAPPAPSPAASGLLPAVTLGTVVVAGIADGVNPCAFTVLLLLVTTLLAAAQGRAAQDSGSIRARVIGLGSIYVAAVFLTYLALGVGILSTIDLFTQRHVPARIAAVLSIALGLWMLKDYFAPELGPALAAPAAVGRWARAAARRMTVPSLVGAGFLIGLCTLPCSGAVYLAVLSLLALQPSAVTGFAYLVLYNVMYILPLVALLALSSTRPALNRLAHWNVRHRERVRLALGTGVVVMGLAILVTL
ncbi:MAG: cytochrome C biogenesis protein [Candidatus Rokubacteria bacterium]|nr:cytochrome C biogenesis protein [Candidatus Rokubacteria bacterium]